ncbi:TonB-dependent receptor plug domain-containing protein [Roseateles oligotrophus]|uniref:TonB-dependent receptor n=1 Tax=Roseateles oligotrophus TaxID=1769250 RepID=A0ABT2YG97_9BURK|nr:TonB-dependent receptor [Roseateles oligotrophus]MCV2369081.1 TonB-dependent receptor [Roseateles oligotrophus]
MTSFSMRAVPAACAALVLLACQTLVLAQDIPAGIGDTPARPQQGSRLERVELSSRQQSDTDLRRKSAVAKQIYGREEMDKYGDTNVSDVLKRLPGVSVQDGAPRMRGLGAGYTLILINGDPAPPGFALDQLSPSQVERIEVTKGPTADQSAQAVAGAINIILKDAPRVSQRDLRLGVGYSIERPTPNANFTLGETLGPLALSLPISVFEWRNQNSFTTERYVQGNDQLQAARGIQQAEQPNWGHGFNIAPRVNWKISDDETASLQTFAQKGYWNNKTEYSETVISGRPNFDDDSASHGTWQNLRGNLQWINRFNDAQRLELKAGVQDSKGTFNSEAFRNGKVQRQTVGNNQDRSFTQAGKFGQLLGDDHSITVGWDLEWRKRDELRTVTENGGSQLPQYDGQTFSATIQRQALFVQDEWELSKQWSTYLGLRAERIATESRGSDKLVRNTSQVVTPLWHLNYKLDPKGRDLIRASLTRSYKAPDMNALLARPSLSVLPNSKQTPDRVGNPDLRPELATGLDIAFEKYLAGGGMYSVGLFHRSIDDLIRSTPTLRAVEWASEPRWVMQPINYSKAQTSGLELEIKGRAGELLPSVFDPKLALNLRGSLSFYRSNVDVVPGPNNRLDGQQPWSGNVGFDYRLSSLPLTTGVSFSVMPGYTTQQTESTSLEQTRTRALDVFAQWAFSKSLSLRLSANNLLPLDTQQTSMVGMGYGSTTDRVARTSFGAALEIKL